MKHNISNDRDVKAVSESRVIQIDNRSVLDNIYDKQGPCILPCGTQSIPYLELKAFSYKNCIYKEGVFHLSQREMQIICQWNQLLKGKYNSIIRRKIKETVNNTCVIYFKDWRYLKHSNSFKMYAYCAHKKYKFFIITIGDVSNICMHKVVVMSSSKNFCHLHQLTSQVRGLERSLFKDEMAHIKTIPKKAK